MLDGQAGRSLSFLQGSSRAPEVDTGIVLLHLRKLILKLLSFAFKCFLLEAHLLDIVFCVCQVVDNNLILIVFVLEFEHVFSCLVFIFPGLADDAEGLYALPDFSLLNPLS